MVEQRDRTSPQAECPPSLDYRKTLIQAGRKLQPLDLSGPEKRSLLVTVSSTLFPEKANDLNKEAGVGDNECRQSVDAVFGSPRLFIAFQVSFPN